MKTGLENLFAAYAERSQLTPTIISLSAQGEQGRSPCAGSIMTSFTDAAAKYSVIDISRNLFKR